MDIVSIKELLTKISITTGWPRLEFIRDLQSMILEETDVANEKMQEILTDLAYDLNFYDPEEDTVGYYGDERLREIVTASLHKIEAVEKA